MDTLENHEGNLSADLVRLVAESIEQTKQVDVPAIGEDEDIFVRCGLDSVQALRLVVRLENHFDIDIGEDPLDFQRIRTFSGLKSLVAARRDSRER